MIIQDDNDTCKICGAYFQNTGYCCNGHLRLTLENIRKFYTKADQFKLPGGDYTTWTNGRYAVSIHETCNELVSVFDIEKEEFLWVDEKTKTGFKELFGHPLLGGAR